MTQDNKDRANELKQTLTELPKPNAEVTDDGAAAPPPVTVQLDDHETVFEFTSDFKIGRDETCDVVVDEAGVSRRHTAVVWADGAWQVRDLKSTNGTHLEGLRVESARLSGCNVLTLGAKGPVVHLTIKGFETSDDAAGDSVTHYLRRYVDGESSSPAAHRTRMIRLAVGMASGRQRRRHLALLVAVSVVFGLALVAVWQYRAAQLRRSLDAAHNIFYAMKELELRLARLETRDGLKPGDSSELEDGRSELKSLSSSYDRFLDEIGLYDEATSEKQRLVLQMARVFGECEATMPDTLLEEVERYIEIWKGGTRLDNAIQRALKGDFAPQVAEAFDRYHLPPQYFYLALQESDFRVDVCGPKTRYGIAKGPWQFIPSTAVAYGLEVGPLYLQRRHDPQDDRHDFPLSSEAAAHYLRDIYLREAQGSGLLSLAIYNYGGSNVRRVIRSLPPSPRERNFWRLLLEHRQKFPRETYDYVLRIFSAAVIGENPRLFGFSFDNPLASITEADGQTEANP